MKSWERCSNRTWRGSPKSWEPHIERLRACAGTPEEFLPWRCGRWPWQCKARRHSRRRRGSKQFITTQIEERREAKGWHEKSLGCGSGGSDTEPSRPEISPWYGTFRSVWHRDLRQGLETRPCLALSLWWPGKRKGLRRG